MDESFKEIWESLENLDETHFSPNYGREHYNKHVAKDLTQYLVTDLDNDLIDPISYEEYDREADELSKQIVRTSRTDRGERYIGFRSKDGKNIKFDTETNMLVVYVTDVSTPFTVSYYLVPDIKTYLIRLHRDYLRELTPEDDIGNS